MDLEQELRGALARKDPPPGFAGRVAAAAAGRTHRAPAAPWRLAAAAAVLMAVGGGMAYREYQGEVAREQVLTAMRVTAGKLHHIQAHVREARQ